MHTIDARQINVVSMSKTDATYNRIKLIPITRWFVYSTTRSSNCRSVDDRSISFTTCVRHVYGRCRGTHRTLGRRSLARRTIVVELLIWLLLLLSWRLEYDGFLPGYSDVAWCTSPLRSIRQTDIVSTVGEGSNYLRLSPIAVSKLHTDGLSLDLLYYVGVDASNICEYFSF